MRINLLSLSLAALGLASIEATVQNVYINPSDDVVCLILPPAGQLIGNTQTIGTSHCTNGTGDSLLPQNFFVAKQFLTTSTYVQAWGLMDDASVGMLTSDGGGQYDIHADSGTNRAPGWAVFVELLEPNTGRWCIRFCHALGTDCNMGNSDAGCEGALKITDWPTTPLPSSGSTSGSTSSNSTTKAGSTTTGTKAGTAIATATGTNANATSAAATAATATSTIPASGKSSSATSMFSAKAPLAVMAISLAALFF